MPPRPRFLHSLFTASLLADSTAGGLYAGAAIGLESSLQSENPRLRHFHRVLFCCVVAGRRRGHARSARRATSFAAVAADGRRAAQAPWSVSESAGRNRLRPWSRVFHGLRIGCGVAQGLALGAGLRVVGVDTLLAMAQATGAGRAVCCLDARMGEIYHAAYRRADAGWDSVHSPGLCAPGEAPALPAGSWTGCGSGFAAHGAVLKQRYAGCLATVLPDIFPHARHIARLAAREFEAGRSVSAAQALPVYIRDKVALKTTER
jgi:tRNA A37 threonylcarbamoyladenosine modification protein TsaB